MDIIKEVEEKFEKCILTDAVVNRIMYICYHGEINYELALKFIIVELVKQKEDLLKQVQNVIEGVVHPEWFKED